MKIIALLCFTILTLINVLSAQHMKIGNYVKPSTKEWLNVYNCAMEEFFKGFEIFSPFYIMDNGDVWAIGNRFIFNASQKSYMHQPTGFTDEKTIDIVSNNEIVYVLTRNNVYILVDNKWNKHTKKNGLPKIDKKTLIL